MPSTFNDGDDEEEDHVDNDIDIIDNVSDGDNGAAGNDERDVGQQNRLKLDSIAQLSVDDKREQNETGVACGVHGGFFWRLCLLSEM